MKCPLAGASVAVLLLAGVAHGSPASAAAPPGTSCSVFPSDNVWNTDISSLPVNAHSGAWLASTGATSGRLLHPDFGAPPYGIPFNVVSSSHATANFTFLYASESDPGPYPYGPDLQVEAPTDSHLISVNKDTCTLYETAGTDYNGPHTGWSGATWNLASNALRPDTWTSADAAGLPIFQGLVRLDEVQAGAINHAIRFTVQQSDKSHLWPARHDAGSASDPNLPPMGARFRLKSSFDISGFNAQAQVVLNAMKHYGLIVADNGSNWFFTGTMDPGWSNEPYATMVSQLKTVPASAFDAVDESPLMVDPNSGQAVLHTPCGNVNASAVPPSPQTTGSAVTLNLSASACANPQFEVWVRYPNAPCCQLAQAYGSSATYPWSTAGLPGGTYTFAVWARDANSPGLYANSLGRYDAYLVLTYTLSAPACTAVSAATSGGNPVTVSATASGCPSPRYQFELLAPGSQTWQVVQAYSPGASFSWSTTGAAPGTYRFIVKARDAASSGTYSNYAGSWDSYVLLSYSLGSATPCSSVTASASGTNPVTVSATASGCPSPRYQFELLAPGSQAWQVVQPYSATATWSWSTTSAAKGTYKVIVKARDASSPGTAGTGNPNGAWDTYTTIVYTITQHVTPDSI